MNNNTDSNTLIDESLVARCTDEPLVCLAINKYYTMNNKCTSSWHCCMVGQCLSSMHCLAATTVDRPIWPMYY